jgi:hypothetical protein
MLFQGDARRSPRFAVLPLASDGRVPRYVIVDRHTARIVDGVCLARDLALEVAACCEQRGSPADMTPTAEALGLLFPSSSSTSITEEA